MKRGDTIYYIDNWEIKEAEVLGFSSGFVTVRYHTLCPELLSGQDMYLNRGDPIAFQQSLLQQGSGKDRAGTLSQELEVGMIWIRTISSVFI